MIGAGKSGAAAANLLAARGFEVLLTDAKPKQRLKDRLKILNKKIEVETGGHTNRVLACGFAVKSPGLSRSSPIIAKLKKNRTPIFSEIETALAFAGTGELLAVTGTNGKTTTAVLLNKIMERSLRARGAKSRLCGNVGIPAAEIVMKTGARDTIVMEVSSYQLEDSSFLRPRTACVLNVTPDHLEHHGTMRGYIKAKAAIFRFQKKGDACVFNADDARCRKMAAACPSKVLFFSSSGTGGALSAWIEKRTKAGKRGSGKLVFKYNGKTTAIEPPGLPGLHNLENAMCAGLMALTRGASPADLRKTFSAFKGVEHRIEPAGKKGGMTFINDSKATNVDSTLVALKALADGRKNIWLILGGLDKGSPYAPLIPYLKNSVRTVLAIGAAAEKIKKELCSSVRVVGAGTMAKALAAALAEGAKGDRVLLSPACASFDQFKDFEDRGRKFKELVKQLRLNPTYGLR